MTFSSRCLPFYRRCELVSEFLTRPGLRACVDRVEYLDQDFLELFPLSTPFLYNTPNGFDEDKPCIVREKRFSLIRVGVQGVILPGVCVKAHYAPRWPGLSSRIYRKSFHVGFGK